MRLLGFCILLGCLALSNAYIDWTKVKHMNYHVQNPIIKNKFRPSTKINFRPNLGVVNGDEAKPHQFPFQVGVFATAWDGTYFCGGSLISRKYVMSAGHCAQGMYSFTLVIGAHNINSPEKGSIILQSSKSVVHPQFDPYNIENDISIIELPYPVQLSDSIKTIKLPSRSQIHNLHIGENSTISGWGLTSDSAITISPVLRYTSNPVLSNLECSKEMLGLNIPETQICQSGADGKGACNGDSGGPLTVTENGETIQVGLTSYGLIFGCEVGFPTAYTRISSFLDFIEQNTDVNVDA